MSEPEQPHQSDFDYHSPQPMEAEAMVSASMKFSINGVGIQTTIPVPAGKTTLRVMLPVLRGFSEALIHAAVDSAATVGLKVSCKAHCGACCRQLVPILESEAYQLKGVIDAMPPERRAHVLERFAAAKQKLQETGMWDRIDSLKRPTEGVDFRTMGLDYFFLGVACPFLEEESCSIHPERPIVCREYLVANDPAFCANPTAEKIRQIRPVAMMSAAVSLVNDDPPGTHGHRVPLVKILDWVAENPEPPPQRTGKELLEEVLTQLLRKRVAGDMD